MACYFLGAMAQHHTTQSLHETGRGQKRMRQEQSESVCLAAGPASDAGLVVVPAGPDSVWASYSATCPQCRGPIAESVSMCDLAEGHEVKAQCAECGAETILAAFLTCKATCPGFKRPRALRVTLADFCATALGAKGKDVGVHVVTARWPPAPLALPPLLCIPSLPTPFPLRSGSRARTFRGCFDERGARGIGTTTFSDGTRLLASYRDGTIQEGTPLRWILTEATPTDRPSEALALATKIYPGRRHILSYPQVSAAFDGKLHRDGRWYRGECIERLGGHKTVRRGTFNERMELDGVGMQQRRSQDGSKCTFLGMFLNGRRTGVGLSEYGGVNDIALYHSGRRLGGVTYTDKATFVASRFCAQGRRTGVGFVCKDGGWLEYDFSKDRRGERVDPDRALICVRNLGLAGCLRENFERKLIQLRAALERE